MPEGLLVYISVIVWSEKPRSGHIRQKCPHLRKITAHSCGHSCRFLRGRLQIRHQYTPAAGVVRSADAVCRILQRPAYGRLCTQPAARLQIDIRRRL